MEDVTVSATGKVGEVYTKPEGGYIMTPNPPFMEDAHDEGTVGWYQRNANTRVQVRYRRVSHSACMWVNSKQ